MIASDSPLTADALRDAAVPGGLQSLALAAASHLAPALPGGNVFTDDRAPVEWLIDASIVKYAAGEGG